MNDPVESARLGKIYERLRDKLLDMRLSNPMLNYRHRPASKQQLQLVDEVLEEVHRSLTEGNAALEVMPLPEPEGIPADEQSEEFRAELDHGRASDLEYLTALEVLESTGRDDEFALTEAETKLRERLREKLGMEPRPNRKTVSPVEHAKSLGIDPQVELKAEADKEAHRDKKLQTLKWPDTLTATLDKLQSGAALAEQEMGLSTLFLVFGFLEWMDSKDSSKRLFAPLLLLPVKLSEHRSARGKISFSLSATAEQADDNLSLTKKLESLGLALPHYDPAEDAKSPIEDYFKKVTDLVSEQPGWRVRRWLTLGHFAFGRFAMYADLDPARWPETPTESSLVGSVLRGTEIGGDGGVGLSPPPDDYDIDSEDVERAAPFLVRDADASQHSAVVDVMLGKNLVIQGPPGTGKSQTIANIIANALAAGKKVLFLSEKMAALEVVKRRLDDDHLGHFCLELHSDKASARQVIQSLKERHKLGYIAPVARSTSDAMWQQSRQEIRRYLDALHAEADIGRPFDQFWRAIRVRAEISEPLGQFRKVDLPPAVLESNASFESIHDRLDQFARIRTEFEASYGPVSQSPWTGLFEKHNVGPGIANPLLDDLADAIGQVEKLVSILTDAGASGLGSVADLRVSPDLARLTGLAKPDETLVEFLSAYDNGRIEAIRQAVDHRDRAKADFIRPAGLLPKDTAQRRAVESLISLLDGAERDETPAETFTRARLILDKSKSLCSVVRGVAPAVSALGFPATFPVAGLSGLCILERSAEQIPSALRSAVLQSPIGAAAALAPVEEEWSQLVAAEASWRSRFTEVGERWPAVDTLLAAAAIREKSGLGGLFSGLGASGKTLEAANKALGIPATIKLDAAVYRDLADHVRRVAAFTMNAIGRQFLGEQWQGIATPLQVICENVRRLEGQRALLAGAPGGSEVLRRLAVLGSDFASQLMAVHDVLILWRDLPRDVRDIAGEASLEGIDAHVEGVVASSRRILDHGDATDWNGLSATWAELAVALERSDALDEAEARVVRAADPEICNVFQTRRPDVDVAIQWIGAVRAATRSTHDIPWLLKAGASEFLKNYNTARANGLNALVNLERHLGTMQASFGLTPFDVSEPARLAADLRALTTRSDELRQWLALQKSKAACIGDGLRQFIDTADGHGTPTVQLVEIFDGLVAVQRADHLRRHDPVLAQAAGMTLAGLRDKFRQRDVQRKEADKQAVYRAVAIGGRPLSGQNYGPKKSWTEQELLHHEFGKERTSVRVLQLIRQAGRSIQSMKPCFMMSPLSLAKFVPAGTLKFDLLVIDEASQMRPEDALGGLLRARQVVVVGDPKQLPPTDFFQRSLTGTATDGNGVPLDDDDESILEACHKTFRQIRLLKWHYRSRCESLIAFSNKQIYAPEGRQLITFPASVPGSFSIDRIRVAGAYADRRNAPEAQRIAEDAILFMKHHSDALTPPSLGIVAMNSDQAELIGEQINLLSRGDEQVEQYRAKVSERGDRLFVKNLENVQGDERDYILISMTYGPRPGEKEVLQRFGPITGKQGHRRLNVLFTRARQRIGLYTSMDASDVKPSETSSRGVHLLQQYLAYVESGGREAGIETGREPDSDFEIHVASRLRARGYDVAYQVGVSGFRLDLAVVHPRSSTQFLAGIECDGARYHASKSARDRDRLRQEVLENLGWSILRVWSTDWFDNPDRQTEILVRQLEELLRKSTVAQAPYKLALGDPVLDKPEPAPAREPDGQSSGIASSVDAPDSLSDQPPGAAKAIYSKEVQAAAVDLPQPGAKAESAVDRLWDRETLTPIEARLALAAFRDQVIAQTISPWEPARSILRESMIETFVEQRIASEKEWFVKIPQYLRRSSNGAEKTRFLGEICDIVSRIT